MAHSVFVYQIHFYSIVGSSIGPDINGYMPRSKSVQLMNPYYNVVVSTNLEDSTNAHRFKNNPPNIGKSENVGFICSDIAHKRNGIVPRS